MLEATNCLTQSSLGATLRLSPPNGRSHHSRTVVLGLRRTTVRRTNLLQFGDQSNGPCRGLERGRAERTALHNVISVKRDRSARGNPRKNMSRSLRPEIR
jgi:hypothetical protein